MGNISASLFGAGRGTDQSVNIQNLTVYQGGSGTGTGLEDRRIGGSGTGGDLDHDAVLDQENGEDQAVF